MGDNFRADAWLYRSCEFRNFCFDTENKSFVLFQTPEQRSFERHYAEMRQNRSMHVSSSHSSDLHVSLGGLNTKWRSSIDLKWFPFVHEGALSGGYYELPMTWVPFHSLAGYNPGHLIWDDFFSIFKMLSMFDKTDDPVFLTRMPVKMWGDCDWNPKREKQCAERLPKFVASMGLSNTSLTIPKDSVFETVGPKRSKYICAPWGAAGIGDLTDHGRKRHGWDPVDYEKTHNSGKGPMFLQFRNYMLANLGLPITRQPPGSPYNIVFSKFSSDTSGRVKGFGKQVEVVKTEFQGNEVAVWSHKMRSLSWEKQASIASNAAIYVTATGGGAVTCTFLPPGATLIMFYEARGGISRNTKTGEPARLDWDLLNHASHLRVHWLPIETLDDEADLQFFSKLIRNELDMIAALQTAA